MTGTSTETPASQTPASTIAPSDAEAKALAFIRFGTNSAMSSWIAAGWNASCQAKDHSEGAWNVQCAVSYLGNQPIDQWAILSVTDFGNVSVLVNPRPHQ